MNEKLDQQFKEIIEQNDSMLTVSELADIVDEIEVCGSVEQYLFEKVSSALEQMNEKELISMYNEYLSDMGDEIYLENDEYYINIALDEVNPYDIIQKVNNGDYNENSDYFKINDCGNLESYETWEIVDEASNDTTFIELIITNQYDFDSDITELFDELDTIKEAWELVEKENSKE